MASEAPKKRTPAMLLIRYWWVFLVMALSLAYFFAVSVLVAVGKDQSPSTAENDFLETVSIIAPWHAEALIAYAEHKRSFAITVEGADRSAALLDALVLTERAIERRPLWPYYHLGALDAEYLLHKPAAVIQVRLDTIARLAPNERGLDYNLIELSLLSWHDLRPDQQRWIAARIKSARFDTRKELSGFIEKMVDSDPTFCSTLPWTTVRKFCKASS